MADEVDLANDRAEHDLMRRIDAARNETVIATATGVCLWCGEVLTGDQRWCDAECRDDWQRYEKHG